jgi:hypothetical protein
MSLVLRFSTAKVIESGSCNHLLLGMSRSACYKSVELMTAKASSADA